MRKVLLTSVAALGATIAAIGAASPALANEGHVDARVGANWSDGTSNATAGIAAGYDFDLGSAAFVGAEVSADKVLASHYLTTWSFAGRLGAKLDPQDKVYAIGGYTTKLHGYENGTALLGGGLERGLGGRTYARVEYRHNFGDTITPDANSVTGGVGVHF